MSLSTKIVMVHEHGGVEQMRLESTLLDAPQAQEVQIQQKAIGLNFIDIYCRTGLYLNPLPHSLGYEGAGIITAVGAEVAHLQVGDRVAYGQSPLGAYAQYRNLPAFQAVKLPDSIGFEEAAAVMLKGLTVQYLFRQTYRLETGETTLLHAAAGGVGLIACQWAKALGVKLIGTVSTAAKAKLAEQMGAWKTINYSHENVVERVLELTQGEKLPVVYDGVGKDTWETSLDCLQPRGLMVSYGNASGAVTGVNLGLLATKGSLYVTRPTLGSYVPTQAKMQAAADELFSMIEAGHIKVQIDQRYTLEEVAQAHTDLAARKTTGASVITLD